MSTGRGGGGGGRGETEKHVKEIHPLTASSMHPGRAAGSEPVTQIHALDKEQKSLPFSAHANTQATEPHRPRHHWLILLRALSGK